jgi:hypothetical protein
MSIGSHVPDRITASDIETHIDADERRFHNAPTHIAEPTEGPRVHDGVWSPEELVAHCEQVRQQIAAAQQVIIDLPV